MAGSEAEEAIRSAVVEWCRVNLPTARVLHELPVGGCRADLAAIEPMRLILFEIKSEKDKLDRLELQVKHFRRASHATVIVAARKWFDETPYRNGQARLVWPHETRAPSVWCHPDPGAEYAMGLHHWRLVAPDRRPPDPWLLLEVLWREEIVTEARDAGLKFGMRWAKIDLMKLMVDEMPGRRITEAVCRQLRSRPPSAYQDRKRSL